MNQALDLAAQEDAAFNPVAADFGITDYSIYQIPAAAFRPRKQGATLAYGNSGLVYPGEATSAGYDYWAPVYLPEGTLVGFMDLYACDSNAASHLTAYLTGYAGSDTPSTNDLYMVSSTQVTTGTSCGYWVVEMDPEYEINNDVRYGDGFHYVINMRFASGDSTNKLKGVDLWWRRQVSPGPATATFGDVPTSDSRYQYVEALVAAGVTAGCGGGNYCPDATVTRGQMAVFIAKALGLHFPN